MNHTSRSAVLISILSVTLAGLAQAGPAVVPFEAPEGGGTPSMVELFKQHYGEQEVDTQNALALSRWNAFKYMQFALSEMMVDPAESDKARQEFGQNRLAINNRSDYGPPTKGWGYMYWNRGDLGDAKVPLVDQSGTMIRATDFPPDIGMEGKNLYMPDVATLDKIVEVLKAQKELGDPMGPSDGQPPEQVEEYNKKARELEQQFLELVGAEVPKIEQTANGKKVYALGYKYDDKDNPSPLELNLPLIRNRMTRLGVPIREGSSQPAGPASTGAAPATASAVSAPVIQVRQPAETIREMNSDYEAFVQPSMSESERTKAEIDRDMFRMRVRPQDAAPGVKNYDLLLTPELHSGGLNLPSKQPDDQ